MKTDIFIDFEPLSKKKWIEQANVDLKGKDFDKTLVSQTEDGLKIQPYYAFEDLQSATLFKSFRQQIQPEQQIPGMNPRYWANLHLVEGSDEKSQNKTLLNALNSGSTGLILNLAGNENFDVLLDQVAFEYIDVFVKVDRLADAVTFFDWCNSKNIDKLSGGLLWDPITTSLYRRTSKTQVADDSINLLKAAETFPEFKLFCIDGAYLHNSGATGVLELKYGLGAYIELLDVLSEKGLDIHTLFKRTMILTAAGSDYFYEIAKIRSYKVLMTWLAGKYDLQLEPKDVYLFGETSSWTKSLLDLPTNMLRNTTEAMACVLGGCEAIYIRPHDSNGTDGVAYAERIARNVSNIIMDEAYFGKVVDPVAGSYYLETLIQQITETVQEALIELEGQGGWWSVHEKREIQAEIKSVRNNRSEAIFNQQQIKVGVNKYVEKSRSKIKAPIREEEDWQLLPSRATELYETLKNPKA